MIFAKIDVAFPRHYRLLGVRAESVRHLLSERERTHTASDRTRPIGIQSDAAGRGGSGFAAEARCRARRVQTDDRPGRGVVRDDKVAEVAA
jgi:hypothetical protein